MLAWCGHLLFIHIADEDTEKSVGYCKKSQCKRLQNAKNMVLNRPQEQQTFAVCEVKQEGNLNWECMCWAAQIFCCSVRICK